MRREWRDWATMLAILAGAVVAVFLTAGRSQLIFAGLVGAASALLSFGWLLGGDVRSMTWIWGRIGEQQTEAELDKLGLDWQVEHDIPTRHGNWDHLAVGPAGLFLLDSKRLHGRATASADSLRAGRTRFNGGGFRHAAVQLGAALTPLLGRRPWVNAVVVVWDDFPQGVYEENRVTYIAGQKLTAWLANRPATTTPARRDEIAAALPALRQLPRTAAAPSTSVASTAR
jgi:hypothetical protein